MNITKTNGGYLISAIVKGYRVSKFSALNMAISKIKPFQAILSH